MFHITLQQGTVHTTVSTDDMRCYHLNWFEQFAGAATHPPGDNHQLSPRRPDNRWVHVCSQNTDTEHKLDL